MVSDHEELRKIFNVFREYVYTFCCYKHYHYNLYISVHYRANFHPWVSQGYKDNDGEGFGMTIL